jgi:hypothetical protein
VESVDGEILVRDKHKSNCARTPFCPALRPKPSLKSQINPTHEAHTPPRGLPQQSHRANRPSNRQPHKRPRLGKRRILNLHQKASLYNPQVRRYHHRPSLTLHRAIRQTGTHTLCLQHLDQRPLPSSPRENGAGTKNHQFSLGKRAGAQVAAL